jgi:alpha-galactosidase
MTTCLVVLVVFIGVGTFLGVFFNKSSSSSGGVGVPVQDVNATVYPQAPDSINPTTGIAVTPLSYVQNAPLFSNGTSPSPRLAPIMGWNSWDSYHFDITESQYIDVVHSMVSTGLQAAGYNTIVIDDRWMSATVTAGNDDTPQPITAIDQYGRPQPDPVKWPSAWPNGVSGESVGYKPLSAIVHSMGMQIGIHIINGMPDKAYLANKAFPGSSQTTQQIVITSGSHLVCQWCSPPYTFHYFDATNPNAQVWLNLQFAQYAEWGIDFVKIDCMFGWNFPDVTSMSAILAMYHTAAIASGRSIALEFSPGSSKQYTPNIPAQVPIAQTIAQQYRMVVDMWDQEKMGGSGPDVPSYAETQDENGWSMVWVLSYFIPISYAAGGHIITNSPDLSFPTYDMWPFVGPVKQNKNFYAPNQLSQFTYPQQQTIAATWAMVRSPMFIGGDVTQPDPPSLAIALNTDMIYVNQYSTGLAIIDNDQAGNVLFTTSRPDQGLYWILQTNMKPSPTSISIQASTIGQSKCVMKEIWQGTTSSSAVPSMSVTMPAYGCAFVKLSGCS